MSHAVDHSADTLSPARIRSVIPGARRPRARLLYRPLTALAVLALLTAVPLGRPAEGSSLAAAETIATVQSPPSDIPMCC
ncbi:hypothetical protein [Streptomyces varsoviensis]|uniref:Uncharacterized protein n=1 Tax=Streptomyces varsoviensis TaxID=67373 RepID=A0ABR5JC30_9ACTN|nr:hypothetical protein [Streptomyces varsoviensis]KOG90892.1 hypothetical protein ADK38_06165 [Streptomyces varsoviensis]